MQTRNVAVAATLALVGAAIAIATPGVAPSHPEYGDGTTAEHDVKTVSGRVTDAASGDPIAGASLNAWSEGTPDETGRESHGGSGYAQSLEDGTYVLRIPPGAVHLSVYHDEHAAVEEQFEVRDNMTHDVAMKPYPPKDASLRGTVVDSATGERVEAAYVNVWRQYGAEPHECKGDVCVEESDGTSTSSARPVYYPNDGGSAATGPDGTFSIAVYGGGDYSVSAWREGFVSFYRTVPVAEGADVPVEVAMKRIPPPSVTVHGIVVDARTGEPVAGAYVSFENAEWQQYAGVSTGKDGRFEVEVVPGYTLVWVRAQEAYILETAEAQEDCPADADCPAEDTETEAKPAASLIAPERCCWPSNGQKYYTWVETRVFEKDSVVDLRVELVPRPEASATVLGWVIDEETEDGIPGAYVSLQNEDTGDWGYAEGDEDGSYKIRARPGHHVVYAHAPGYFQAALTQDIEEGANKLVVRLTKGENGYGGPVYYAGAEGRAVAAGGADEGSTAAAPPASLEEKQEATAEALGERVGASGAPTYVGEGGGLGPYSESGTLVIDPEFGAPAAPVVLVLGVLGIVASVWRRP